MKSAVASRATLSEAARRRMLAIRGEPMFYARWDRAVFIHYAADPAILQRDVPFELDLRDSRAFISVVAFTLVGMRPRIGGVIGKWLLKPIATHEFLNVRTYVRHNGEPGIFFLAEWLSNPLSVCLGPRSFGLPYRFGRIGYDHHRGTEMACGKVRSSGGALVYEGRICADEFRQCETESLAEFLLERYTAFTHRGKCSRLFRVWHSPWPQVPAEIEVADGSLIASTGTWWNHAELIGANYSPGAEVWMGRPHRIALATASKSKRMARHSASTVK
jgi:uncharacterized protein YqjF (DUF2071 family)